MFSKLFVAAIVVGGTVLFIGADVVGRSLHHARASVRASLTADVPLRTQVAEARAQVDLYAENVLRGELASETLADALARGEREVRVRRAAVERERAHVAVLHAAWSAQRREVDAVAASDAGLEPSLVPEAERDAIRRAREFTTAVDLLARREADVEALRRDHEATLREVAAAKEAQARLVAECVVLEAEVEALETRALVARTRIAPDAHLNRSGFAAAEARLRELRTRVREQDRRLAYYAHAQDARPDLASHPPFDPFVGTSAVDALGEALAAGARERPGTTALAASPTR